VSPGQDDQDTREGPANAPALPLSSGDASAGGDGTEVGAPDLAPPAFQRGVLTELTAAAGVTAASRGPFRIRVTFATRTYDVRLDEMYKRYRGGDVTVAGAADEIKAALGVPGTSVRAAGPYPRLTRRSEVPDGIFALPCPFDADLAVTFVRTLPVGHVPVPATDVVDGAALYAEALDQLRTLTHTVPGTAHDEGAALVLYYEAGDGLDASRALLPDLLAAMADLVQGQPLVAIPARDLLLMIGDADPAVVAATRELARERFAGDPFPLSERWYTLAPAGELVALTR
jgi:hypothetical protein